jgi:hypothetical protein
MSGIRTCEGNSGDRKFEKSVEIILLPFFSHVTQALLSPSFSSPRHIAGCCQRLSRLGLGPDLCFQGQQKVAYLYLSLPLVLFL